MKSFEKGQGWNRRAFLGRGTSGALLGSLLWDRAVMAADGGRNPFAYDVEKYRKTDPALLGYARAHQFKSPRSEPRRLVVGPEDRLYLAAGSSVVIVERDGTLVREIAAVGAVRSVAVGPDGTLYVGHQDHVEVYDPKGKRLAVWEALEGKAYLTGLAAGAEDVFAADAGNRVVWRYDRAGKRVGKIGEKDRDRNVPGLILPSPFLDVEIGRDGLLRVNNPGRHRVELYTFDGRLELFWGKPSMAIQGFCGCCNPVNLALFDDGRVVTFEKGLPRVKVYSAHGDLECVVAGPEAFADTASAEAISRADERAYGGLDGAVDSEGRVVILDLLAAMIHVMEPHPTQAANDASGAQRKEDS